MKISFSPPDMSLAEAEEVKDTLMSGWITTGPKTKEFERCIARFCNTDRAVALNSATAAMELALHLIGVGPGDEVILPAYTYTATCSVICHVGATPVMIDCAPGSFEMDYDRIAEAITPRTKVIMPVDLAGVPCDYDRIFKAIESRQKLFSSSNEVQEHAGRVIVLADGAHAFGARYGNTMDGAVADFTAFSFHAVKNLTTAEGGALTWSDLWNNFSEKFYSDLQLMSLHGQNKDALSKTELGAWEYDIIAPYYKCNMTDIMAGIGLAQFRRYPEMLRRRRDIIGVYNEALKDKDVQVLDHYNDRHTSSGHLYLVRLLGKTREQTNEVIRRMAESEIPCNVHYKPLPMMTAYRNRGFHIKDYPNAYNQYVNEITIPLHTSLTDEQVNYIITKFCKLIS